MRRLVPLAVFCAAVGTWACGGGGSYSSTTAVPTTPTTTPTPSPGPSAGSTISIVANDGSQAFSPNPTSVNQGTMVAWSNNTSVTHHIVMDDGSMDTGNIAPGATSSALTMASASGTYHCTIHPSMVGSINGAVPTAPGPCPNNQPYCVGQ
jgi:plastocyanin